MSNTQKIPVYTAVEFLEKGSGTITICGSTKYFVEALECIRILTFQRWMLYSCGSWGHSYHKYAKTNSSIFSTTSLASFEQVKKLHFQKILESQAVVVVSDSSGYYGSSTKAEIAFAGVRNIPVFYFDGEHFTGKTTVTPIDRLADTSLIDEFAKGYGGLGF